MAWKNRDKMNFKPGYKPIRFDDDKSSKAKSQSDSSSRVPCYLFFFIVAGCIGFAALSSYVRFSQPRFQINAATFWVTANQRPRYDCDSQ